ncbi:MAG: histone deacetylase family protein [Alphaproteobacteria bacterium]|nr:histone deacetylase family protein [Alphaproteobacteria bacterium]
MATALFSHPSCYYHETPIGHPETADRLRAVLHALEGEEFQFLVREEARPATREEIARIHDRAYIDQVLGAVPLEGQCHLDADTVLSPGSGEAALCAAGAVIGAVDAVMAGEVSNAFCAVRPPGHHAERAQAMGFCIFNNVAIGAAHARAGHGLKRIAVIDFDVHHGNGTQSAFEADADFYFASTHQWPLYPGTGDAGERGIANNILNAPLPARAGSDDFRAMMAEVVLPAIESFAPEFILISAGFDAHRLDPLADLRLDSGDYGWVTEQIVRLAARCAKGRVVSTLEGGYNLNALASSAQAHVRALMEA